MVSTHAGSREREQEQRIQGGWTEGGLSGVLVDIGHEVARAEAKHAPMNSPHEGYAVILEELDELKAEVWKGGSIPRDPAAMRKEAVEVAAMAVRFIRDVCDGRAALLKATGGTPRDEARDAEQGIQERGGEG